METDHLQGSYLEVVSPQQSCGNQCIETGTQCEGRAALPMSLLHPIGLGFQSPEMLTDTSHQHGIHFYIKQLKRIDLSPSDANGKIRIDISGRLDLGRAALCCIVHLLFKTYIQDCTIPLVL